MRTLVKTSLIAIALSSVSTIALAQATTGTATENPTLKSPAEQTEGMRSPSGAATEQTMTPNTGTSGSASASIGADNNVVLATDAEKWVGKRIHASDGSDIGELAAFKAHASGNVEYFRADIGGFLGMGETNVQITPAQLQMREDKVYIDMTAEQAKALPRADKNETK